MSIVSLFLLLISAFTKPAFAFPGIPAGYPTPVSIPHAQSDWANTNFSETYPEYGPIGSDVKEISWYAVNPSPGNYNWTAVENYLNAANNQRVYLRSGKVIPKPVSVCIGVYSTGDPPPNSSWDMFKDLTPSWVYGGGHGHIVEDKSCGKTAIVPKYDDPNWRNAYYDMVRAFGEEFGNDPRLTAVSICSGIDGELIDTKNWAGCSFRGKINFGGHWQEYVYKGAEIYREVFPNKPIYHMGTFQGYGISAAGGYKGALEYNPPIGYKINAMTPDSNNHWAWIKNGEEIFQGTSSLMQRLYQQAPTAMESGPAYFQNWIALRDTEYRLEGNPDHWAVSGKYGDYEYWLYRPENVRANMNAYPEYKGGNEINQNISGNRTVVVNEADLPGAECRLEERPPESWKARRTDQANGQNYMSFKVDDDYPAKKQNKSGYKITVTYVDQNQNPDGGEDKFLIQYKKRDSDQIYSSAPATKTKRTKSKSLCHNQDEPIPEGEADYCDWWQTHEFILPHAYFNNQMPGGTDFRIYNNEDGDDIIHMVKVTAGVDARPQIINFNCDDNGNCSPKSISIDIDTLSQENFSWQAVSETPWIKIDKASGQTPARLVVSIKQDSSPGNFQQAYIGIHSGKIYRSITVRVNAPIRLTAPSDYQCLRNSLGDFNCDQKIDEADLNTLLKAWGPYHSSPDLNGDNKIDQIDLDFLLENWRT